MTDLLKDREQFQATVASIAQGLFTAFDGTPIGFVLVVFNHDTAKPMATTSSLTNTDAIPMMLRLAAERFEIDKKDAVLLTPETPS